MPGCLLDAYVRELGPIRAERLLDWAEAASVPHMGKHATRWWNQQASLARGRRADRADVPHRRTSAFFWSLTDDGKVVADWEPTSGRMLKANLGAVNRELKSGLVRVDVGA